MPGFYETIIRGKAKGQLLAAWIIDGEGTGTKALFDRQEQVFRDEGFPPELAEAHNHFGLMGMKERARIIGAELSITSSPGAGTRVHLRVPLQVPQDDSRLRRRLPVR